MVTGNCNLHFRLTGFRELLLVVFFFVFGLALFTAGNNDLACLTTLSTVKPNFSKMVLYGADAPKWSRQIVIPSRPTYRSQPRLAAASTASLVLILFGRTAS